MNFTDKDLKQSLGYLSDITVFLNTGSCPDELTNGISNPVVRLLE